MQYDFEQIGGNPYRTIIYRDADELKRLGKKFKEALQWEIELHCSTAQKLKCLRDEYGMKPRDFSKNGPNDSNHWIQQHQRSIDILKADAISRARSWI